MSWAESDIATLKYLWGNVSTSIIGDRIGKSKNAVIGKAHRLGLENLNVSRNPRKITKKMKEKKKYVYTNYGKCQWIEGDPVFRRTTNEGKCLKRTIIRDNGQPSSYCPEHTERAWRLAPKPKE